jgi:ribonucleoside-diphosphate reductase alpha chain
MDYIFRRLALDYLDFEARSALGIYSAEERQRHLETGSYEPIELSEAESLKSDSQVEEGRQARLETDESSGEAPLVEEVAQQPSRNQADEVEAEVVEDRTAGAHTSTELLEKITGTAVDSPLCFTCGTKMRPAGSCYVCEGCGSTSGCS